MNSDNSSANDNPSIPHDAHEPPAHPHIENTQMLSLTPNVAQVVTPAVAADAPSEPPSMPPIIPERHHEEAPHRRSGKGAFLMFFIFLLFLVIGGGSASAALIAYDKITLPNTSIQNTIRHVVLGLSFAPKTPRYILEKSALAHANTTSVAIDASVALSTPSLLALTGTNDMDFAFSGFVDYHDKQNIETKWSAQAGNLFAADVLYGAGNLYFKINTLPEKLIATALQMPEGTLTPFLNTWMSAEGNALPTDARENLDKNTDSLGNTVSNTTRKLLSDPTLMKKFTLSETQLDGEAVYKLVPLIDAEFISQYRALFMTGSKSTNFNAQEFLDKFNNLTFEGYLGKNDFLVRKLALTANVKSSDNSLVPYASYLPERVLDQDIAISGVIKFKDFGKDFSFEVPSTSRKMQDVFLEVLQLRMQQTASESAALESVDATVDQFAKARDSQRKSDLLQISNAVYQFASEHNGNLPDTNKSVTINSFPTTATCIGTAISCFNLAAAGEIEAAVGAQELIVPKYLALMPKDPSSGSQENTAYTIYRDANGRIVLTAQGEIESVITVTR